MVYTCFKTQRTKHFFCVLSQMLCACETFTLIFTYLSYKDVISYIMKVCGVRVFSTNANTTFRRFHFSHAVWQYLRRQPVTNTEHLSMLGNSESNTCEQSDSDESVDRSTSTSTSHIARQRPQQRKSSRLHSAMLVADYVTM